jgi:hypothetical protein
MVSALASVVYHIIVQKRSSVNHLDNRGYSDMQRGRLAKQFAAQQQNRCAKHLALLAPDVIDKRTELFVATFELFEQKFLCLRKLVGY